MFNRVRSSQISTAMSSFVLVLLLLLVKVSSAQQEPLLLVYKDAALSINYWDESGRYLYFSQPSIRDFIYDTHDNKVISGTPNDNITSIFRVAPPRLSPTEEKSFGVRLGNASISPSKRYVVYIGDAKNATDTNVVGQLWIADRKTQKKVQTPFIVQSNFGFSIRWSINSETFVVRITSDDADTLVGFGFGFRSHLNIHLIDCF